MARVRGPQRGLPGRGARRVRARTRTSGSPRSRAIRRSARRSRGRAASRSREPSTSSPPARRAARRAGAAGRTWSPATGSATAPRTTRSGSSARSPGARSATARRSACARASSSASASCTSRPGRWRPLPRPRVTAPLPMAPVPRARAAPAAGDTSGLDRLEAARDAVAARAGDDVAAALDELDRVFEEVTGRPAARAEGDSGGGRTIAYLDCMRDLDVTLGPEVVDELRSVAAGGARRVALVVRAGVRRAAPRCSAGIAHGRSGPLAPQLGPLMGAGFGLWDQLRDEQARAPAALGVGLAGATATPSPTGRPPGTARTSTPPTCRSPRPTPRRSRAATSSIVLGDFHGGDNPLAQGLFALRHPDPAALLRRFARRGRPRRAPLAAAPRRGRDDRAQLAALPRGRHRGDERR